MAFDIGRLDNQGPELLLPHGGLEVDPTRYTQDQQRTPRAYDYARLAKTEYTPQDLGTASPPPDKKRSPFWKRPWTIVVLVAVITLLVAGAAIGGGVGASLAAARRHNAAISTSATSTSLPPSSGAPSSTSSSTHLASSSAPSSSSVYTNYVPPVPGQVTSLFNWCPSINNSVYTSPSQPQALTDYAQQQQQFLYNCGVAYLGKPIPSITTLLGISSYTVTDCIDACANMNGLADKTVCQAITWDTRMSYNYDIVGMNCWLLNQTGPWDSNDAIISAVLMTY